MFGTTRKYRVQGFVKPVPNGPFTELGRFVELVGKAMIGKINVYARAQVAPAGQRLGWLEGKQNGEPIAELVIICRFLDGKNSTNLSERF